VNGFVYSHDFAVTQYEYVFLKSALRINPFKANQGIVACLEVSVF